MDIVRYCKRCGRKLKSDESRNLGYGPTCWKKRFENGKPLFKIDTNIEKDIDTTTTF